MPGMDGKQVMKLIRKLGIDAPILICSGYSESEVYTEFAGLDIAGVIAKPFAARMLALRVGAVLDSREAHQRQD
jgi:DNA-binding response OmpR family regulator